MSVQAEKVLVRPAMCAASSKPLLLINAINAISTKISYAGIFISLEEAMFALFMFCSVSVCLH